MKIQESRRGVETVVSAAQSPELQRLLASKARLEQRIKKDDPEEWVWWWIAEDAFELPPRTIQALQQAGPEIQRFFAAANALFYGDADVRRRLEKRFTPNFGLLNRAQPEALPHLIRPDVVLDRDWQPKFVELEITVCARYEMMVMAEHYGLDPEKGFLSAYARLVNRHWPGRTVGLLASPCPAWPHVNFEAYALGENLRRKGLDVVEITDDNIAGLRFDGKRLLLSEPGYPVESVEVIDRFVDIYEIAELRYPGIAAVLDAYLAGAVVDMNTSKQFLDEKEWMALFWEPALRKYWRDRLGEQSDAFLRQLLPRTWRLLPDTRVELRNGDTVPVRHLHELPAEERMFVIKESGTSETSSGAQSLRVLHQMAPDEVAATIDAVIGSRVPFILQETVASPRISFTALNPNTHEIVTQHGARMKLSVFYVDGAMTDIKFIASNARLAVNDERCVEGVVRY